VPIEDLECLEAMEDADDIREAQLALKEIDEQGSIPFDEMKKTSKLYQSLSGNKFSKRLKNSQKIPDRKTLSRFMEMTMIYTVSDRVIIVLPMRSMIHCCSY